MKRRSKKKSDKEADAAEASPEPVQESAGDMVARLENRLAPVESLSKELDDWRKETSAQLARLSANLESDRDNKDEINKRLEGFEERLGALISLTEMISMEDNPFVDRPQRSPPQASASSASFPPSDPPTHPPSQEPPSMTEEKQAPHEKPEPGQSDAAAAPSQEEMSAEEDEQQTGPHRKIIKLSDGPSKEQEGPSHDENNGDAADAVKWDDEQSEAFATKKEAHNETDDEASTHDEPGEEVGRNTDREQAAVGRYRAHPNDPAADAFGAPAVLSDVGSGRPTSEPVSSSTWRPSTGHKDKEAARRLRILQLSHMVACHLPGHEHAPFLGAYVASGWIDRDELSQIQPFIQDLARSSPSLTPLPRHELHERTILLLSGRAYDMPPAPAHQEAPHQPQPRHQEPEDQEPQKEPHSSIKR
jgi:hypothetical protein